MKRQNKGGSFFRLDKLVINIGTLKFMVFTGNYEGLRDFFPETLLDKAAALLASSD